VFCGTGACAWGFWTALCVLAVAAAAGIGLLGFFLYRRLKKNTRASAAQQ